LLIREIDMFWRMLGFNPEPVSTGAQRRLFRSSTPTGVHAALRPPHPGWARQFDLRHVMLVTATPIDFGSIFNQLGPVDPGSAGRWTPRRGRYIQLGKILGGRSEAEYTEAHASET